MPETDDEELTIYLPREGTTGACYHYYPCGSHKTKPVAYPRSVAVEIIEEAGYTLCGTCKRYYNAEPLPEVGE